ncbi:MAG TPA: aryl-sulfate sulfotransferase, partial [Thermoanaerobaculia bacterium]|nr:aryl-sulfate sulfotransferase [Thermoanaerobaculia bacterium]
MADASGRGNDALSSGGRPILSPLLLAIALTVPAGRLKAAIGVALSPNTASPAPVGTMVHWTAFVGGGSNAVWYRFRVYEPGGAVRLIRDFGPLRTLDWTALDEGAYQLEVTVRDLVLQSSVVATSTFQLVSRVGGQAVVSPTSHPLVFLFSSPGCATGRARARFESAAGLVQFTPDKPCAAGTSLNFYLAGLTANTTYSAGLVVDQGREASPEAPVTFTTGPAPFAHALPAIKQTGAAPGPERLLLQTPLFLPPFATDLEGNLVWYGPSDLSYLTRPEAGGTFFGIGQSVTDPSEDVVRKFDLVGMTIQETNAARVSEQLVAMGKRPITGFHHEARTLSDGRVAVLGAVEQILTDVQGPGPVDILGDMILILDGDLQVVWSWDCFDHLDVHRAAVLGETCLNSVGCAPYYQAANANDWTHGNALGETPDGALLFSSRHQDWLFKIDYDGGQGSGDVIWRLGKDGDFTIDSNDPYPWFSHQHDPDFVPGYGWTISLFDNGNTRSTVEIAARSRGQFLQIDEAGREAHLALNANMGVYSLALGSAQRLSGGNAHFEAGFVLQPQNPLGGVSWALETSPSGDVVWSAMMSGPVYRSFRIVDLYGETLSPARPG